MRVYTLSDRWSKKKMRVYTASEAKGLILTKDIIKKDKWPLGVIVKL